MDVIISDHAIDRAKQRCGIPRKAVLQLSNTAHVEGIERNETVGNLRKFLDYLADEEHKHRDYTNNVNKYIVFSNYVWLFENSILVTVLKLPSHLANSANAQRKRHHA